jgi:Ca-activated chloride channel homolog
MNAAKFAVSVVLTLLLATAAAAKTQILLERGARQNPDIQYTGVVDLAINPGFDNAKVTVLVDGQKIAEGLLSPHHIEVDFGPAAIQHKITVIARGANNRHTQWSDTINRGYLPLSLKVKPVDLTARLFEAETTSPKEDPIELVQLWENGQPVASTSEAPYRFTVSEGMVAAGFVQVTAKTKSGEEAADFWSAAGAIHSEELQVRTVPIFVSVVDRDGQTHTNVDRSQFRIMDEKAEGKIIEFGKAFDQPISIALVLDASASMTYSMKHAARAAADFVESALKDGDRCSVTAVQDVPRRKQPLTSERAAVAKALQGITPMGRTALYDGVASAIRELREEKNRRAIVVLTDGGDTNSTWSFDETQKLAREAGIPIYFIAYEGGDEVARQVNELRHIAAETGGFVATATQQNLMAKYNEIERDLRGQFAILYQVSDFAKTNQYRRIRVTIDSPKLSARTIKGYFTP